MAFLSPISTVLVFVLILLLALEIILRIRAFRAKGRDEEKVSREAPRALPADPKDNTPPASPRSFATSPRPEQEAAKIQTISSQELLQEAEIYLQYGRFGQAATVLRWYVDLHPTDSLAINKLLDTYLAMEDYNEYAEFLGNLGESHAPGTATDSAWWEQRIQEGLRKDPGNLELLVLAEKHGIPPATSDSIESMNTAKALAIVSRSRDPAYIVAVLHAAIRNEPLSLPLYAELLRITFQQKDITGYENGLLLLAIAMGRNGASIQDRMLCAGRNLGPSPFWDQLASLRGNQTELREWANHLGLTVSPHLPPIQS